MHLSVMVNVAVTIQGNKKSDLGAQWRQEVERNVGECGTKTRENAETKRSYKKVGEEKEDKLVREGKKGKDVIKQICSAIMTSWPDIILNKLNLMLKHIWTEYSLHNDEWQIIGVSVSEPHTSMLNCDFHILLSVVRCSVYIDAVT